MVRILFCLLLISSSASLAEELPADLRRIIDSAHEQVGVTLQYDPSHSVIPFPGGDVPVVRGVCTDVIIRAYRSVGVDLQLLVTQDMRKAFSAYPRNWGLSRPDPNIDHRRVLNLAVFFTRHGQVLPASTEARYLPPGLTVRLPTCWLPRDSSRTSFPVFASYNSGGLPGPVPRSTRRW